MKHVLFFLLIALPIMSLGQKTEFESYDWNTIETERNTDTIKCVNGVAVTLDRRIFEVYLNAENYFEEVFVFHRKIKVESHDALSAFNKIYISLENVIDILNIKARFISPAGKITVLPKESIKQIANMDNDGDYKTFAIEGGEVGGQIEYFYVLRKKYNAESGYYLQDRIPKSNVDIIFAYPSKIEYLIKSYNGFPVFKLDTQNQEKTYQRAHIDYIPAIEEEKYANYKASLMRFEYTLSYNHYNSALRKYSWKTACDNTYNNVYDLSKNDKSVAQTLYKQITHESADTEHKIRAIENWVKTNISIKKEIPYQKELSEILRLKQANNTSVVKLFIALLTAGNVDFEFIETGTNEARPFDPDFNCTNFLNSYLIYFPKVDKYLSPDNIEYRLGLTPENYQGQYGLFMHPVGYNENITALAYQVKQIPIQDNSTNTDSLYVNLSLNSNETDIDAKIVRRINGAFGRIFQNLFQNLTEEKRKDVCSDFFSMGKQEAKISSLVIKNDHPNNIGLNPLVFDVSLKATDLIENAGNNLLFHVGETIGRQAELYQEQSRKLPIHVGVLHNYYRKIIFQIPEGYVVANPENLEMKVEMKNGDKTGCIFTSHADIKDRQLIIISREYYNDETYPASRYPEFRDVINASADFNKKVILLKKM